MSPTLSYLSESGKSFSKELTDKNRNSMNGNNKLLKSSLVSLLKSSTIG